MSALVDIKGLKVVFHGDRGRTMHAVDTVNFDLARGATLGLVGESGCGKSVTALAIMGLLPKGATEVHGHVRFDGVDLVGLPDAQLRDLSFGVDLMKRQMRCLRYGSFRVRAGMPVAPFLTFGCKLDDRPFRVSKCFDSSSDQPADGSPFAHIQRMG